MKNAFFDSYDARTADPLNLIVKWFVLTLITLSIVIIVSVTWNKTVVTNKHCEYFKDWTIDEVPVRCFDYYAQN